ncbi:hypothetical protein PGTUg99_013238 [Puccinia graminis f. sp. tritici]|uniref:Uncharacterized protein n=1 Tax=Puccinia graminis f. sp. tritici TaxID=56615 RepID=A0A5B0SHS8_PUCGR|nr:hypothetical protein PGTUg99_013238 [Puccinia graminis f. sp. tritici]
MIPIGIVLGTVLENVESTVVNGSMFGIHIANENVGRIVTVITADSLLLLPHIQTTIGALLIGIGIIRVVGSPKKSDPVDIIGKIIIDVTRSAGLRIAPSLLVTILEGHRPHITIVQNKMIMMKTKLMIMMRRPV